MIAGVIGCGRMGENHVRVYSQLRGIDDVLVYDVDSSRCSLMKSRYGAVPIASLHDLLQTANLVSICVPTSSHLDAVRVAVDECVPFLVEKPIAGSLDDAYTIESLRCPVGSGVGHIERFNSLPNMIVDWIKDPRYVSIRRHNPGSIRVVDTDVVDDLMIHDIDLARHLFFDRCPDSVVSVVNDCVAHALLKFGDCVVSLSSSRVSDEKVRDIRIECDTYTVVGDFITQEFVVYRKPGGSSFSGDLYWQTQTVERFVAPRVEPLQAELAEFIRCVREKDAFPVSIEEAVENMETAEMIKSGG